MENKTYGWTDNPTVSGVSQCDTDVLNECLMYLRYNIMSGRNVGDVFYTLRKESGSLNGAFDCKGVELCEADFDEGQSNPYTLLVNNLLPWVSYEDYETQIQTNDGTCSVFALDKENHKFKTPTLKNVYITANSIDKLGEYIQAVSGEDNSASATGRPKSVCCRPMVQLANIVNDKVSVESYTNRLEAKTNEGINALANASNSLSQTTVTNCLLSIPKRLNIVCSDNILTIKAGSIATIPNGFEEDGTTPKFDYKEITSDIIVDCDTVSENLMIAINKNNTGYTIASQSECYCSESAPAASDKVKFWYDKTSNKIKSFTTDSQEYSLLSFPVCAADCIAAGEFELQHVFDGAGYIGQTVWLDKDIKCLIPAGKNADGSLNSTEYTTQTCLTACAEDSAICAVLDKAGVLAGCEDYDSVKDTHCFITSFSVSAGLVTHWKELQAIELLKRSDIPELTRMFMPSDRSVNLTLGASGTAYTAPADGYVVFCRTSTATNQSVVLRAGSRSATEAIIQTEGQSSGSGNHVAVFIPVKKGETFYTVYSGGNPMSFKFTYAQGAQ